MINHRGWIGIALLLGDRSTTQGLKGCGSTFVSAVLVYFAMSSSNDYWIHSMLLSILFLLSLFHTLILYRFMESQGILDGKCDTDLYCLHLCFKRLLVKSINIFRHSWNLHKHRGLRHKSPSWVFEQGLLLLHILAIKKGLQLTELEQVPDWFIVWITKSIWQYLLYLAVFQNDWRKLDCRRKNPLDEESDNDDRRKKISVPRITCPLTAEDDSKLRETLRQDDITWKNAVDRYIETRNYVYRTIAYYNSSSSSAGDSSHSHCDNALSSSDIDSLHSYLDDSSSI